MCERERRSVKNSQLAIFIPPPAAFQTQSIPIDGISVFRPCLAVMAGLAKSLPVAFIPHQMRITTVRNDMVDYSCCCEPSPCHTLHAQRMLPQVRLAEPLPPAAIATLGSRRSVWVQGLMLCTVQTVCQIGTAWVLAGLLTFLRHSSHSLCNSLWFLQRVFSMLFGIVPSPRQRCHSVHLQWHPMLQRKDLSLIHI